MYKVFCALVIVSTLLGAVRSLTVAQPATFNGPFAFPITVNLTFAKSDNVVTVLFPDISGPCVHEGIITSIGAIPAEFVPGSSTVRYPVAVRVFGGTVKEVGGLFVSGNNLAISRELDMINFPTGSTCGIFSTTITWINPVSG